MSTVDVVDFESLVREIKMLEAGKQPRLVAIDGRGGAGKTRLAERLQAELGDAVVVAVDDFWLPSAKRPGREIVIADPGSDYDWRRLRDHLLVPLRAGRPGRYQRYDWPTDSLSEWHDVASSGTVIVEGVFSTRDELASYYDRRIWVETPAELCLERGIERDGERGRDLWKNEWMPAYENYIERSNPRARADYVIEGN